jgi:endonuclease-3
MKQKRAEPEKVDALLLKHYGKYPAETNPKLMDELLWFMLSTRTTVQSCEKAFQACKLLFPTHEAILKAPIEALAAPLKCTGFSNRRAADIRESWRLIQAAFGRLTLSPLKRMTTQEAEAFLLSLPGVGTKVARCFLQFGLNANVFAVDTHIWRISQRLGWIPDQKGAAPHQKGVDAIQALVPMTDAISLHVNMIFLGRDFCHAQDPNCSACPLNSLCLKAK